MPFHNALINSGFSFFICARNEQIASRCRANFERRFLLTFV